jgi:hypothetical protein
MKKRLLICFIAVFMLFGCNKDNQHIAKKEKFDPAAFMKEADKHGMEWYLSSVSKLKPEEAAKLEEYNKKIEAEKEAKLTETMTSMLANAKTKESVNDEGQKVIEYTMVNTIDHDIDWFQLAWQEGGGENVSDTADNVKKGQTFKLIVDPAFDKTLKDIDMSTIKLTSSEG